MKKSLLIIVALACLLATVLLISSCGNGGGSTESKCDHKFKTVTTIKEPTCAEDGFEVTECKTCDYSSVKRLPSTNGGHKKEIIPAVEADCNNEGLSQGEKCSLCGEILVGQASTGKVKHAYADGICVLCGANANSEGIEYILTKNDTYSVKSIGSCDSEAIVIPSEYEGKPVTSILDSAFKDCKNVKSIEVPNTVTKIGKGAFEGCIKLEKLVLPFVGGSLNTNGVAGQSTLFGYIFGTEKTDGCYGVKQMTTKSEGYTFYIPSTLKIVRVSNGALPYGTFYGIKSLTSLEIGGEVSLIGNRAFYGCTSLSELYLPDTYTKIEEYAFYNCSALTTIDIPSNVSEIGAYAFSSCSSLESIKIPSGVSVIGEATFYKCGKLTEISVPSTVNEIGAHAFQECTGTTRIILADGVTTIGDYAFSKCSSLKEIQIPSSVESIGEKAFNSCTAIEEIVLNDGLTQVGDGLFYGCSALKTIEIPASVTTFGKDMFIGCTSLNELVIDENNPDYASLDGVLYSKDKKTLILYMPGREGESFEIPDYVEKIETYAFYGNESLKSIIIPKTVKEIGEFAFANALIESVTFNASMKEVPKNSFKNCSSLEEIILGDSVESIGDYAFYGSGLIEYKIPSQIISIGKYAFAVSVKLTKIEIPSSVKVISEASFRDSTALTDVVIADGVQEIGKSAFSKCTGLKNIVIPTSVTKIGGFAFNGCTSLTEIFIPLSVGAIGEAAFQGCQKTCTIRCEASEKPADWSKSWNNSDVPVIWNATND